MVMIMIAITIEKGYALLSPASRPYFVQLIFLFRYLVLFCPEHINIRNWLSPIQALLQPYYAFPTTTCHTDFVSWCCTRAGTSDSLGTMCTLITPCGFVWFICLN